MQSVIPSHPTDQRPPHETRNPLSVIGCSMVALLPLLAGCGGATSTPEAQPAADEKPAAAVEAAKNTAAAAAAALIELDPAPVVRFAAYGPAPSTYGPGCGTGIVETNSGYFRLTVPPDWKFMGSSNAGAGELYFDIGDTRVEVNFYAQAGELSSRSEFENRGETGATVDLPGTSLPLHDVAMGDQVGFGLVGFTYIEGIPRRADPEGSAMITSRDPDLVSPELAAEVLATVRVERCRAVKDMLVYGPASRRLPVPEFAGGDPLGKTRPDQPAPAYVPGESALLTYSEEQVAYLLPLAEDIAACVAPLVRADADGNPLLHMQVFLPNGTHKKILAGYVARCGG